LVSLKLYRRLYAPLTAGILTLDPSDARLLNRHQAKLDQLYKAVDQALTRLQQRLGIAA